MSCLIFMFATHSSVHFRKTHTGKKNQWHDQSCGAVRTCWPSKLSVIIVKCLFFAEMVLPDFRWHTRRFKHLNQKEATTREVAHGVIPRWGCAAEVYDLLTWGAQYQHHPKHELNTVVRAIGPTFVWATLKMDLDHSYNFSILTESSKLEFNRSDRSETWGSERGTLP